VFTGEVHVVDGAEGKWLADQLGRAMRDLITWAHEDRAKSADVAAPTGEERIA
jgi:hypothetical protein